MYIGTNDLSNNIKLLQKKKLRKLSAGTPSTRLAFFSMITRKDKRNLEKPLADTKARLKNFCATRGFNDNENLKNAQLGKKKLYLKTPARGCSLRIS